MFLETGLDGFVKLVLWLTEEALRSSLNGGSKALAGFSICVEDALEALGLSRNSRSFFAASEL